MTTADTKWNIENCVSLTGYASGRERLSNPDEIVTLDERITIEFDVCMNFEEPLPDDRDLLMYRRVQLDFYHPGGFTMKDFHNAVVQGHFHLKKIRESRWLERFSRRAVDGVFEIFIGT
jgi:hypothetical protein